MSASSSSKETNVPVIHLYQDAQSKEKADRTIPTDSPSVEVAEDQLTGLTDRFMLEYTLPVGKVVTELAAVRMLANSLANRKPPSPVPPPAAVAVLGYLPAWIGIMRDTGSFHYLAVDVKDVAHWAPSSIQRWIVAVPNAHYEKLQRLMNGALTEPCKVAANSTAIKLLDGTEHKVDRNSIKARRWGWCSGELMTLKLESPVGGIVPTEQKPSGQPPAEKKRKLDSGQASAVPAPAPAVAAAAAASDSKASPSKKRKALPPPAVASPQLKPVVPSEAAATKIIPNGVPAVATVISKVVADMSAFKAMFDEQEKKYNARIAALEARIPPSNYIELCVKAAATQTRAMLAEADAKRDEVQEMSAQKMVDTARNALEIAKNSFKDDAKLNIDAIAALADRVAKVEPVVKAMDDLKSQCAEQTAQAKALKEQIDKVMPNLRCIDILMESTRQVKRAFVGIGNISAKMPDIPAESIPAIPPLSSSKDQ